jgi:mycofactocin biosynthesis protein MftB
VSTTIADAFDASQHWRLSEEVSIRDESFGALAYHHGTRRLVFLKSRELVGLVRAIGSYDSANAALSELVAPDQRQRYADALASLLRSGLLRGR